MRNLKTDLEVGNRQSVHISLDDVEHPLHVDGDCIILGVSTGEDWESCYITLTRAETYRLIDALRNTLAGDDLYKSIKD